MTKRAAAAVLGVLMALTALPAPPAAASPEPVARVSKVKYPGDGVQVWRHSGKVAELTGTPRSFKRFVAHRLERLFASTGRRPECARSPLVTVGRYHGDGFASFAEGIYRACPDGGYAGIYVLTPAGWRAPLAGQEAPFCADLQWYAVPLFVAGRTCVSEDFDQLSYALGRQPRVSPPAVARRLVTALGGQPIVPTRRLATDGVVDELTSLIDHGAYLAPGDCVAAGDGTAASASLGDAPYGCVLTAHLRHREVDDLLRMYPGDEGAIIVGAVVPLA